MPYRDKNAKLQKMGTQSSWSKGKKGNFLLTFSCKRSLKFVWSFRCLSNQIWCTYFLITVIFLIISKFNILTSMFFFDNLKSADKSAFEKISTIYDIPFSTLHFLHSPILPSKHLRAHSLPHINVIFLDQNNPQLYGSMALWHLWLDAAHWW